MGSLRILMKVAFIALLVGISSCVTTTTIVTNPDGVSVLINDKKVGTTPYVLKEDDLKEKQAGGILLSLDSSGYKRVWLWIPDGLTGTNLAVNMQPFKISFEEKAIDKDSYEINRELANITGKLLELQGVVFAGGAKSSSAGEKIDEMLKKNPNIPALHYLKYVVSMKNNKKEDARKAIELAIARAPHNTEYAVLFERLKEQPKK